MNRQALLLYLQNVCDLEIVKYQIERSYKQAKHETEHEISSCYTVARHKDIPDFVESNGGFLWLFCVFVSILDIMCLVFLITEGAWEEWVLWLVVLGGGVMFGIPAWAWRPGQASEKRKYEEEVKEIEAYNAKQDQRAIDGRLQVMRLQEIQRR